MRKGNESKAESKEHKAYVASSLHDKRGQSYPARSTREVVHRSDQELSKRVMVLIYTSSHACLQRRRVVRKVLQFPFAQNFQPATSTGSLWLRPFWFMMM